ncbi:DUF6348 family protein [Mucilaginibacter kameinonensis]|uniref:DUF6348 family protein n=1 Tax=Mucilaginibacter kameinonensis TaxID=452286 RepID=UPI000EF78F8A|nr:DUF6348 family protein [Mucilaginibacter kameinonensis]
MGLFDLFKKKPTEPIQLTAQTQQEKPAMQQSEYNGYLTEALESRLLNMGYQIERHPQYLALIVDSEIEIAAAIVDIPGAHPFIMQVNVLKIHPVYFPKGIYECLVGFGETIDKRINSALDNYLDSTFSPIMAGFSDTHDPDVDLLITTNNREVLWHPKLGDLMVQGQWEEMPDGKCLFEILREKIKPLLTNNKFNWLKIYISKNADGAIIGECVFNNQLWNDALDDITQLAEAWIMKGEFKALKQFIMFRRCDAYDNI